RTFDTENKIANIDGKDTRVNVDVAVIDTGIDYTHPDLNVYKRTNCVPASGDPEAETCIDNQGIDGHGHGTHVAGIVGAIDNAEGVVGMAPGARLWAVKGLNDGGSGYLSWIIAGIDWVQAHASEIEVVNMSFGCSNCYSPPQEEAIQSAIEAGVVVIAAAGNSAKSAANVFPASYPDVVAVSALADYDGKPGGKGSYTCSDRGPDDTLASFSNYGSTVDIAAPGVCIYSTLPISGSSLGKDYGSVSGTSMASPHVAGAAALLASQSNPNSKAAVQALDQKLLDEASLNWTDTAGDLDFEPLLFSGIASIGPEVATAGASEVAGQTATLNGVVSPNGLSTGYHFEYGTSTGYGTKVPTPDQAVGSEYKNIKVSKKISGLKPGTTYHYRVAASSEGGWETYVGQDRTFTTTRWSVRSTPNPSAPGAFPELADVSCGGPNACMAVGSYMYPEEESPIWSSPLTLSESWDGSKWTIQKTVDPNPPGKSGTSSSLKGVSCATPSWCMAVGNYREKGVTAPLAEIWNGTAWSSVSVPALEGKTVSGLDGVSCTSASSCVAVGGSYVEGNKMIAIAAYWNGSKWSIQTIPGFASDWRLSGVSCVSATSCFAVGTRQDAPGSSAIAAQWNGSSWSMSVVSAPAGLINNTLYSVSCTSAASCTAVGGGFLKSAGEKCVEEGKGGFEPCPESSPGIVGRWNGTSWTSQQRPLRAADVSCVTGAGCMAIGSSGGEWWNESAWAPEPTAAVEESAALKGVSCDGGMGCVAVGARNATQTLAEHAMPEWANRVAGPPLGAPTTFLADASCVAPEDCFAVGSSVNLSGTRVTLAKRGGGSGSWSQLTTPNPAGATESYLEDISCTSAVACTAVGRYRSSSGTILSLAERWNGTSWSIQATPNPVGGTGVRLEGVSCSSATACTAVGRYTDSSGNGATLAERWNGTEWTIQSTPNPGPRSSFLHDVSCRSASDCWAVGGISYKITEGKSPVSLVERWNGSTWSSQILSAPEVLNGISCPSTSSCTAVGVGLTVQKWNGSSWSSQSAASPPSGSEVLLSGVSCPSTSACVAVGSYSNGHVLPLAEHLNGSTWSVREAIDPVGLFEGASAGYLEGVSCTSAWPCNAVGYYKSGSNQKMMVQGYR
ncbi:MAG TPA: S8 family serine peptidase, partial [Gemmatimonadales bacterium]|nr:S8 family serine peptidase [Gemmatimonadales bacterium]